MLISLALTAVLWALAVAFLWRQGRRGDAIALARFVPDCAVLFKRLLADGRISRWRKAILIPLLAYLASPIDLVPDFVPVAGQLDDAIIAAFALRLVLKGADEQILRDLWPGPTESLDVLERFALR